MQIKDNVTSEASNTHPLSAKRFTKIFTDSSMRMFGKQRVLLWIVLLLS